MPRYIDADKLFSWGKFKLSDAVKYGNKNAEQQNFSYSTLMMYEIAGEIEDAETADVAPIRRVDVKELLDQIHDRDVTISRIQRELSRLQTCKMRELTEVQK